MNVSATSTAQLTTAAVSPRLAKAAAGDGDGRMGAAALNDGDAAAQAAARSVKRSSTPQPATPLAGSVDVRV